MQRGRVKKRSKRVKDIVVTAVLEEINHDLKHWRETADMMSKNHPNHEYAVVEGKDGNYICLPITPNFKRKIIYKTGCVGGGDK